ncbi:nuclear transport factor 2 family protein [bacterium]|nr:nuclear transport factor 2 family protein [bacterium]
MINIKKYFKNLFIIFIMFCTTSSISFSVEEDSVSIDEKIASVGFGKIFASEPQKEITNLFKKIDYYTEKQDLKKIREFYSDDFVNNDGFDIDTYMKSVKAGASIYCNIKIESKINSVSVNGNYAVVHVTENAEAETVKPTEGIDGSGLVIASADIYYYLQNNGRKWKIVSANVIDENHSILYGYAKNIYFSLNTPTQVKSNTEYTSSLTFAPIKDILVSASLASQPIVNPLPLIREPFKTVKNDGVLERIFTANTDGYNEYTIASICIAQPQMVSQENINFKINGAAFVIRRVNVFKPLPQKIINKKNSKG